MQHKRCGKASARLNNAISNCSVSPTLDLFNSELDKGSTTSSMPAFRHIISHKHVLPFIKYIVILKIKLTFFMFKHVV